MDKSVETKLNEMAHGQKRLLVRAVSLAEPLFSKLKYLTQWLAIRPSKAEVANMSNAVTDGHAAPVFTGESAVEWYLREDVKWVRSIMQQTITCWVNINQIVWLTPAFHKQLVR